MQYKVSRIWFSFIVFFMLSGFASAGFKGSIAFTPEEKIQHEADIERIAASTAQCLKENLDQQNSFYAQYGISKYYGDNSSFSRLSYAGKKAYLKRLGKSPTLVDQMLPTSCVGMVLKCLGGGFKAVGQDEIWEKIRGYTIANGVSGDALIVALRTLGWKTLYWNPDTRQNAAWDAAELLIDPENKKFFNGAHAVRYSQVLKRKKYLWTPVDDATTLVDFKTAPPESFKNVPLFVGIAHMGYHVFPGFFGEIIEAHSTRAIRDSKTVETSFFNPLANGGGPRGKYWSGVIAVPPRSGF